MSDIVDTSQSDSAVSAPGGIPPGSIARADNPPGSSSARKPRRQVERILVWSLIAVLLALAGAETWSRYSFQRAYDFLGNRLEKGDEHTAEALDATDVKKFLGDRKPSRTEDFMIAHKSMSNGATHLEVYSWFTLNPVHRREMFVYYDAHGPARKAHPQVLSIQSVEEEFVPLLSQREQQFMERMQKEETRKDIDKLPGMSGWQGKTGMPGAGSRRGPGGRPGSKPAVQVDQPADDSGPNNKPPAADTTKI